MKAADARSEKISERAVAATIAVKPAERKLLEILLNHSTMRRKMMAKVTEEDYGGLRTTKLFRLIFEFEHEGREASYPALCEALDDEELARELLPKLMIAEPGIEPDQTSAGQSHSDCAEREAAESLHSLRCAKLAEKQAALQVEINQAQRANDTARVSELMMLKFELAKQERALAQWNGE
jgi:hypothetical protein